MSIPALRHLTAAAALAAALSACGQEPLQSERVEAVVKEGIEKQTGAGTVEVECPEEIEAAPGEKFMCRARTEGAEADVEVTRRDEQGNIRWEIKPDAS